jgi:nucleotide-binding universal stress UspA family protein
MPVRTRTPTAGHVDRPVMPSGGPVLAVVPDGGHRGPPPDWVLRWCRRSGSRVRHSTEKGPGVATAAAQLDERVLLLRPTAPPVPGRGSWGLPRVVAALRDLPDDGPVIADAVACAARLGAALVLVHAVPRSFGERSVDLAGAVSHGRRLLDTAATDVAVVAPHLAVEARLLRMLPYELVGESLDADLLVVGGIRSGDHAAGPGLVALSALHHAACPVLVTRRAARRRAPG